MIIAIQQNGQESLEETNEREKTMRARGGRLGRGSDGLLERVTHLPYTMDPTKQSNHSVWSSVRFDLFDASLIFFILMDPTRSAECRLRELLAFVIVAID